MYKSLLSKFQEEKLAEIMKTEPPKTAIEVHYIMAKNDLYVNNLEKEVGWHNAMMTDINNLALQGKIGGSSILFVDTRTIR